MWVPYPLMYCATSNFNNSQLLQYNFSDWALHQKWVIIFWISVFTASCLRRKLLSYVDDRSAADVWRNDVACAGACPERQTRKWCAVSRLSENINISSVSLWIRRSRRWNTVLSPGFPGGRWAGSGQRCGSSRRRCCWPGRSGCPSGPTRSSSCRGGGGTAAGVDSPVSSDITGPLRLSPGLCSLL